MLIIFALKYKLSNRVNVDLPLRKVCIEKICSFIFLKYAKGHFSIFFP